MGRPPLGKHAMSGAERQRRYIDKLINPAAKPETAKLKQDLAAARARIAEVEAKLADDKVRIHELERTVHTLLQQLADADRKPKTLPPDAARERTIKRLKKQIENLENLVANFDGEARMPRDCRIAIDKVLHPDARKHGIKDEVLDEACKRWNAWKSDNDKANKKS
jgi:predicted RNase H-like nuclease (RuvC/YqgF family)